MRKLRQEFDAHTRTTSYEGWLEDEVARLREQVRVLREALDTIANDHEALAHLMAKGDWHDVFNWCQQVAKTTLAATEADNE